MSKVRVGIIGGGWSGVYAAKYCMEAGMEPTLLESSDALGGQWRYQADKSGGVRASTKTVSSKLYMAPVDFPYPDDAPEFLSQEEVYAHFNRYVDHFKLAPHVQLNQHVESVYKESGEWVVQTQDAQQRFDKLIIATGSNKQPKRPQDPVYQNFTGKTYHSHDMKTVGPGFDGRNVLVIGGSDTASDLACEMSQKSQVTVSIRNGTWFQDRYADEVYPEFSGYPADMVYNRFVDKLFRSTDYKLINHIGFVEDVEGGWGKTGSGIKEWECASGYLNTYYTKSRDLVRYVRDGKVQAQRGVEDIDGKKVKFHGDSKWYTFDDIIFCTGYSPKLDFECPVDENQTRYRKIIPKDDPSIAFIGYVRPYVTSIVMLVEMQARWVASMFSGKTKLPTESQMSQTIADDERYRASRFPDYYQRMPALVDPYTYMNNLAKEIGQYPQYWKLWLTRPKMAYHTLMDSWNPFAFSLHHPDPEKRKQAEKQILQWSKHPISAYMRNLWARSIKFGGEKVAGWIGSGISWFMQGGKKSEPDAAAEPLLDDDNVVGKEVLMEEDVATQDNGEGIFHQFNRAERQAQSTTAVACKPNRSVRMSAT